MSLLRQYIRDVLEETFQSHSYEPVVGDIIVNINPGCMHKGSEGVVLKIDKLPDNQGNVIEYQCLNDGPTWEAGDVLTKTMDQLAPLTFDSKELS